MREKTFWAAFTLFKITQLKEDMMSGNMNKSYEATGIRFWQKYEKWFGMMQNLLVWANIFSLNKCSTIYFLKL
jgi:hypothetical protein